MMSMCAERSVLSLSGYFKLLLGLTSNLVGFYPYDIMIYPQIKNHNNPKSGYIIIHDRFNCFVCEPYGLELDGFGHFVCSSNEKRLHPYKRIGGAILSLRRKANPDEWSFTPVYVVGVALG